MTKPPETRIGASAAAVQHGGRLLSPARYRHPGDVIRLIVAGLALAVAVAVTAVSHATESAYLAGGERPRALATGAGALWWLSGASPLGPALLAVAVACTDAAAPWLSRPWRRTAWIMLYRLATYWLLIAPGWLAWRALLRREYA